jgi:mono/diheme cytochrome c family protein
VPKQRARYPRVDLLAEPYRGSGARDFVRRRIAAGRGPMPAFRRKLTPGEIEKLVDYVLRLNARGRAGQAGQGE